MSPHREHRQQGERTHREERGRRPAMEGRRAEEDTAREHHLAEDYQHQADQDENEERVRAWMEDVEPRDQERQDDARRSRHHGGYEGHGYSDGPGQSTSYKHSDSHGPYSGDDRSHHHRYRDDSQARDDRWRDRTDSSHWHRHVYDLWSEERTSRKSTAGLPRLSKSLVERSKLA
ncbi:hypothetical protein CIB48_g1477 [Xylaria polymorpha]|nr:hypothetical protein CIB48_g1477 [Xylaria polymorpha]